MKKSNKTSWLEQVKKRNADFKSMTPEQQIEKLQDFVLKGHPESEKIKEQIFKIKGENSV